MNINYLKEIYEENKEDMLDTDQEIESFDDFIHYIKNTIISNIEYDFNIGVDIDKLLNMEEKSKDM